MLPLLWEDSSGPVGEGLLTSEVLAVTIREIQAELSSEAAAGWPVVGFGTSIFTRRGSSKRAR